MEFKGTKGKWKYYKKHDGSDSFIVGTKKGFGLFFSGHHSNTFERHANALLISKSPEMLELHQSELKTLLNLQQTMYDREVSTSIIQEIERMIFYKEQLIKQVTEI